MNEPHDTHAFAMAPALLKEVMDSPGFSSRMRLSAKDLALFRFLISAQWLKRIGEVHPELVERAESLGLAKYHELSPELNHEALWPKEYRILDISAVSLLKQSLFFRELKEIFGTFGIAEGFYGTTHVEGLEEIYWRLVRPNAATDVGPLHADHWFHDIMDMKGRAFAADAFTLKIWIPIYCEAGRNGLLLVADSHKREWKHGTHMVNGQPKPSFDDQADPDLILTNPGQMLIFHERTLHGGAINRGEHTRVSAEITLVFDSVQTLKRRLESFALGV